MFKDLKIVLELSNKIKKLLRAAKEAKYYWDAYRLLKLCSYWVSKLDQYIDLNNLNEVKILVELTQIYKREIGYYKWLWGKRQVKKLTEWTGINVMEKLPVKKPYRHFFELSRGFAGGIELGLWK